MKNSKSIVSIIAVVFLVIVLFATNPKADQFHQYLKETIKNEGIEKGGFGGLVEEFLSSPTASLVDLGTKRSNYYLFSTYEINVLNMKYIGILNNFFEISE